MNELKTKIESLLFISHKPLGVSEIAKILDADKNEVKNILQTIFEEYNNKEGGIKVLMLEDKYQMATSPESSEIVSKFIKNEVTGELTRPSLETLTIIAYRGPISKAELELIRGVNCSLIIRNLLMRGLIEAKENKISDSFTYTITFDFLKFLGIEKVEDLPDFEKLNRNNNLEKLLSGLGSQAAEINNNIISKPND